MVSQSLNFRLNAKDYERVNDYEAIPRATILRNLIKKRQQEACNLLDRQELNLVSQGSAMYVSNPISSMLQDQIEFGRA